MLDARFAASPYREGSSSHLTAAGDVDGRGSPCLSPVTAYVKGLGRFSSINVVLVVFSFISLRGDAVLKIPDTV